MNKNILNIDVQNFINNNLNKDITSILLKKPLFEEVSLQEIAQQIESKKKCQYKLPTWFNTSLIYYPKKISIEQTSSETTAKYKASLVKGNTLADITGGFGVDSYFFSKQIDHIHYCEIDNELSSIAAYNFTVLKTQNIITHINNGIDFLNNTTQKFDWLYIDPSRRTENKGKVFMLSDCLPNVIAYLPLFLKKADNILLKTSPLLDITNGLRELSNVKEIHIVAIKNEVKELLWIINNNCNNTSSVKITTINIQGDTTENFSFYIDDEQYTPILSPPLKFLFEPNAAIRKAGAFNSICKFFLLKKLHQNSHLYTHAELISFPGRVFKIQEVLPYKKTIFKKLPLQAHITTRNFPESVASIRKKTKIKDGGNQYLFFTTLCNNQKVVIFCDKI